MSHLGLDLSSIKMESLLKSIDDTYGYDFSRYKRATIHRRLEDALKHFGMRDCASMTHRIVGDPRFFHEFLNRFTVTVTEFFRDPKFFKCLLQGVVPYLQTHPFLRVWVAGCASGEEAYSMAILLEEVGLLGHSLIYATDINPMALSRASRGVFPADALKKGASGYFQAGGKHSLSDYFTINFDSAVIHEKFRSKIVFSDHNLVTDHSFSVMHLIVCRNVLIYFNRELQDRVLGVFAGSLIRGGFLGLGSKESIGCSDISRRFEEFIPNGKVYRMKAAS